jgi:hypothetical protein
MANNLYPNTNYYNAQQRQPGQMAAYLLGMAPMPPRPKEVAVALANHALDHPDAHLNAQFQTGE